MDPRAPIKRLVTCILLYFHFSMKYLAQATPVMNYTTLKGQFFGFPLLNLNNTSDGSIEIEQVQEYSYHTSIKSVASHVREDSVTLGAKYTASAGIPKVASIKASVGVTIKAVTKLTASITSNIDKKASYKTTKTYNIGPHSSLKLYQIYYRMPGVVEKTDTLVSFPPNTPDVKVEVSYFQEPFLIDFEYITFSSSEPWCIPLNSMRPYYSYSKNFIIPGSHKFWPGNYGAKIMFVIPIWGIDRTQRVTSIQYLHTYWSSSSGKNDDFGGQGAEQTIQGRYQWETRRLILVRDPTKDVAITWVRMYTSENVRHTNVKGLKYCTQDIHSKQGGPYLNICWKYSTL